MTENIGEIPGPLTSEEMYSIMKKELEKIVLTDDVPPSLKNSKYETTTASLFLGSYLMSGGDLEEYLDQLPYEDNSHLPELFKEFVKNPNFKGFNWPPDK
jgi:hypothetical protein